MHCLKIFQKCCKGALEYKRDHANHRRMLWFGKPYSYPNFFLTSSPSWATKDFLGKWRKLFRTRTRPNDSGFFPVFDIPLYVISLNLDFSAPTGPVCLILVTYYDRFTIYHNPIFRLPEIVFRRVISEKKSVFGLLKRAVSFWNSVLRVSSDLLFFAQIGKRVFGGAKCRNSFCQFFSASFCQEKREKFNSLKFLSPNC